MTFQVLDEIEHARRRPSMYIGSTAMEEKHQFLNHEWQSVSYVPGLLKIVNEVIDNSIDEFVRTSGKFANKISINLTSDNFSVQDNGRGIPVEKIKDLDGSDIFKPVAAWCRTKAGSNFGADEDRETIGMNGVGSALSNIFSTKFIGETSDGKNRLIVECDGRANIKSIDVSKSNKKYTKVSCWPDFTAFESTEFTEVDIEIIKNRLENLAISYPEIEFKYNGTTIKATGATAYLKKFSETIASYHDEKLIVGFMNSKDEEFRYLSLVNGLNIINGGSHIDYLTGQVVDHLREMIKKKYRLEVAPGQIRGHIQLISVIRGVKNLKFDSQTKEKITNTRAEVAEIFKGVNFEKIAKDFIKHEDLIMPIIQSQLLRLQAQEAREAAAAAKKVQAKKVAKHIPATSRYASDKMLFITEGDSAIGQLITVRNPEIHGGYPIRGKILNIHGMKPVDIMKNKVLSEIMNVVGLKIGEKATNPDYGTICLLQDGDVDGQGSIAPLLMKFFYLWPELYSQGRVVLVRTPIIIATKGEKRVYFYTSADYNKDSEKYKTWEVRYIKGLGTLRSDEYQDMINEPVLERITIDDAKYFDLMFGDDADARKKFMMGEEYENL